MKPSVSVIEDMLSCSGLGSHQNVANHPFETSGLMSDTIVQNGRVDAISASVPHQVTTYRQKRADESSKLRTGY